MNIYNKKIIEFLLKNKKTISVAESLTGGLLANSFVDFSGVSKCFNGGVITYTLEMKEKILDIPLSHTKLTDGVDEETSKLMAINVANLFDSDYSISTTGIAEKYDDRNIQIYITIFDKSNKQIFKKHLNLDNNDIIVKLDRNKIRDYFVKESIKFFYHKIIKN